MILVPVPLVGFDNAGVFLCYLLLEAGGVDFGWGTMSGRPLRLRWDEVAWPFERCCHRLTG